MNIKDIKLGLKMMKYGLQYKTMKNMFIIFIVLGTIFEFLGNYMGNLGGLYLILVGTYMYQMIITSTISTYISSSPKALKIQSLIPGVITCATMLLGYTYFILLRFIHTKTWLFLDDPEFIANTFSTLLLISCLAFVIQVYNAFAYKFFMPSMILMVIIEVPLLTLGMNSEFLFPIPVLSFAGYILAGYIIILAGGLLGIFTGNLIKRKALDPRAYKTAMTRAGK